MSEIVDRFDAVCKEYAERPAIICRVGRHTETHSFSELSQDVGRMCSYFASCDVKQGDRILTFAPTSYKLCVYMLAALKTGASVMYVDIRAKQEKLRTVFADYRPDLLLVSDKTRYLRLFFGEIGKIRRIINIDRFEKFAASDAAPTNISEDAIALLTMTTGSTGKPKIALRSHRDLMQQLMLIKCNLRTDVHEIVLTTSYIYVFANILNGFTTVMPQVNTGRWNERKLNRALSVLRNLPVSMLITSPDFCLKAKNQFPNLRTVYCGGAILNYHEAKQIRDTFEGCDCRLIYGSTECNLIAMVQLPEYIRMLETEQVSILGRPVEGVRVRLTEDGEILVASDALLERYLVEDAATKETDSEGTLWHHTNDIACLRGDLLCFLGKNRHYIMIGDEKHYSNCIEQAIITQFPDIPKCAVLQHEGRIHVVLERGKSPADTAAIGEFLRTLGIASLKFAEIKKIPCDVKHHTKINYEKLKESMKHGKL